MDDRHFMTLAIELAKQGIGHTSPNPVVGAVVVRGGRTVGSGFHRAAGGAHAEIYALDDAGDLARGADLFVTLEPCNHFGRTPPCTDRILQSGIRRVIIAMPDPNPDVRGEGAKRLEQAGTEIVRGVCEEEARILNEAYIKYVTTKQPFVIAKVAATLDGHIATRTGDARWVSGSASRQAVHRLRHAVDAIMVGVNTVKADNPQLTTRLTDGAGSDPIRLVLDTSLSIPGDAKILNSDSEVDTVLVAGESSLNAGRNAKKRDLLVKKGVRIITSPLKNGRVDLMRLMERLGGMEITSLLIEGGSRVMGAAFKSGIVDKVNFFYAPKVLGGDDGYPVCSGRGAETMAACIPITRMSMHRFEDDVMIQGYVGEGHPADRLAGAAGEERGWG